MSECTLGVLYYRRWIWIYVPQKSHLPRRNAVTVGLTFKVRPLPRRVKSSRWIFSGHPAFRVSHCHVVEANCITIENIYLLIGSNAFHQRHTTSVLHKVWSIYFTEFRLATSSGALCVKPICRWLTSRLSSRGRLVLLVDGEGFPHDRWKFSHP